MDKMSKKQDNLFKAFFLTLFIIGLVFSIITQNLFSFIVNLCGLPLIFLPNIIYKLKINMPYKYILIYYFLILFGIFLGEVFQLYYLNLGLDKMIHFITGIIFFILGVSRIYICKKFSKIKHNLFLVIIYGIFFVLFIESFWELIEASFDIILGTNLLQEGLDSIWDIIMNLLGSFLGAILLIIHIKIKKIKLIEYYLK